jgi:hypothetical protein
MKEGSEDFPLHYKTEHITLSAEADFELAYCSTSTPVPLSAQARQERISAQKKQAGTLLEEQEVMS